MIAKGVFFVVFLALVAYYCVRRAWDYWKPYVICYFGHRWYEGDF
jgi:hypothetical protein